MPVKKCHNSVTLTGGDYDMYWVTLDLVICTVLFCLLYVVFSPLIGFHLAISKLARRYCIVVGNETQPSSLIVINMHLSYDK